MGLNCRKKLPFQFRKGGGGGGVGVDYEGWKKKNKTLREVRKVEK